MNINALSFTTREEYLQWRSEWRATYKKLSQDIRDQRWLHAMGCRVGVNMVTNEAYWMLTPEKRREYQQQIENEVLGAQVERYRSLKYTMTQWLSAQAKAMLEVRKASKVEAQRQYLAQHQAAVAS